MKKDSVTDMAATAPLLLDWYDQNARLLPWREDPSPYRTWISEIMLQQTRVETVIPYFEAFVAEVPHAAALAALPDDRLLKLWQGLGYYSRARNLKLAAQRIMERHGGQLPASFEALRALPGLGDYAAGAVASIAFGIKVPAVDGNVLRVFARLTDLEDDITLSASRRRLSEMVTTSLPEERVGDYNQAIMDLGATICLPNGTPLCHHCPLVGVCAGFACGKAASLPRKSSPKARRTQQKTVFLITMMGKIVLRRRPSRGLLAGLWEPPTVDGTLDAGAAALLLSQWGFSPHTLVEQPTARHIFTHIEWDMTVWHAEVAPGQLPLSWEIADKAALAARYPLPTAFHRSVAQLD